MKSVGHDKMKQEWIDWISRSNPKSQLAIKLAAKLHSGQADEMGNPYIKYIRDIADRVCSFGEDTIIIALLHDSVKYEKITLDKIEEKFGSYVRSGVDHMTQREDENYLEDFLPRALEHPASKSVAIAICATNLSKLHLYTGENFQYEMDNKYSSALRLLGISEGLIEARDISFIRCPWFRGWLPKGGWKVEEKTTKVDKVGQRSPGPSSEELYMRRPIEI